MESKCGSELDLEMLIPQDQQAYITSTNQMIDECQEHMIILVCCSGLIRQWICCVKRSDLKCKG